MKSIMWKEFLEIRLPLLIQLAFGVLVCLALSYFRLLESGILMYVLFIFTSPTFCLMNGMRMFAPEVKEGTLPFLVGLPLSRPRIWAAKTLFAFASALVIYVFYCLLTYVSDVGIFNVSVFSFYSQNLPKLTMNSILWAAPLFTVSLALFASTLAPIFGTLVFGLYSIAFFTILFSTAIHSFNFFLSLSMLGAIFLIASYQTFVHGELMDSWKKSLRGILVMSIGVVAVFAVWIGLDRLADRMNTPAGLHIQDIFHFEERLASVIVTTSSPVTWWNPIQEWNQPQILRIFPKTQEIQSLSPRLTSASLISPDGRYLIGMTEKHPLGCMQLERMVSIDLWDNNRMTEIDTSALPMDFLSNETFLYEKVEYSQKQQMAQLIKHTIGSGSSTIYSYEKKGNSQFLPTLGAVLINSVGNRGEPVLIDVDTGKLTKLPYEDKIHPFLDLPDGVLFTRATDRLGEHRQFLLLTRDGRIEEQPWIASDAFRIAPLQDGAFLAKRPLEPEVPGKEAYRMAIVKCDMKTKTVQEIAQLDAIPRWGQMFYLDARQQRLIFRQYREGSGPDGYYCLDLSTKAITEVPGGLSRPQLLVLSDSRFFLWDNHKAQILDLDTMQISTLGKLRNWHFPEAH